MSLWSDRSCLGAQGVMDPADAKGLKNKYIDIAQKRALEKELDISSVDRILDFGCGIGRISSWLASFNAEVVGIDSSIEMIEEAKENNSGPDLMFECCDSSRLPYEDNYFDKIISVMVMQHILESRDLRDSVREICRVLKPGGRIFLLEHVMRRNTSERYQGKFYKILRTTNEYIDLFRSEDFTLTECEFINFGIFYKLITMNILPSFFMPLVPLFVTLDTILTRGKGVPKIGYINCLFVFEKE